MTELIWSGKRTQVEKIFLPFQEVEVINKPRKKQTTFQQFPKNYPADWKNMLIWGDNKLVMSSLLKDFAGKINLIYIDPPFATGADFSMPIKIGDLEWTKEPSIIEELAYRDTWGKGIDSYLQMMYERLVLMRELLAETGSIYVHLDYRVVHYVKIIMDEIFGKENFQNDIIWSYRTGGVGKERFAKKHDIILFYSKCDEKLVFNPLKERIYYEKPFFSPKVDEQGRYYADVLLRDVIEGEVKIVSNNKVEIINTKPVINVSKDRLDFPTQKPEGLIEILLRTSSNEGDIVADFFCGSGTTLAVAEKLGRRWIGCDLSKFAIHVTRKRLLEIPTCRPFVILNLGNYQKHKFIENGKYPPIEKYIHFILQLYRATPIQKYYFLHGKKDWRFVHVGPIDAPITEKEVNDALEECISVANGKGLDILGWEFEMGLDEVVKRLSQSTGVEIRLKQIPKEVLELRDVKEEVRFFDMNSVDIGVKVEDRTVELQIKDFILRNLEYVPEEIRNKIKKSTDYIDYWAVDFDFKNDVFHNQWQTFRTRKRPKLETKCKHTYEEAGKYNILVKVIDIFGNDTNKLVEVEIK